MNKKSLKLSIVLLALIMMILLIPNKVNAGNWTASDLASKLHEIRNTEGYKPGQTYLWNSGGWGSDYCSRGAAWNGSHAGYECFAYGLNLFDWLFGQCSECHANYSPNIDNLCVGDVIRLWSVDAGHTIVVQDIVGETVYFTDANSDFAGTVRWDQTYTKSYLRQNAVYVCHADGNDVKTLTLTGDVAIDTVTSSTSLSQSDTMLVQGWATSNTDECVQIYIDGKLAVASHLVERFYRSDVPDGNAGYKANISLSGYSVGTHTLKVYVFENNTNSFITEKSVTFKVTAPKVVPSVKYQIQVEDEGWHSVAKDNEVSMRDTSGHKIEAMKIYLENATGGIEYNLHLENRGWQGYRADGTLAGIENGGLRAEGIKIRLTGSIANSYDVYYRVHTQNIGWLSWAKNGEAAGSSGAAFRIEGLQIVLVKKGESAPTLNPAADRNEPFYEKINVKYQTHIENIGWQTQVRNGATSGAPGRHLRIEGIKITKESTTEGGLSYQTHVQNKGWLTSVTDGALAGTEGLGLRTEAVKISLTGDLANTFDVYYRIYVEDVGWLGWAKNGEEAGSTGYGKKLEGIEIRILKKGDATAPTTGNSCLNK